MSKNILLPLLIAATFFFRPYEVKAQSNDLPYSPKRLRTVVISEVAISTAAMIGLHYLWYKKFPRSRFHLFNDNGEWLAMDKVGHAVTAYNLSAIQCDLMRWSGVSNTKAAWIGGLTALGVQTIVEIFDGFSTHWGFSKGDMLANITGAAIFTAQQLAWKDQRVRLKFSFHKTLFAQYNPGELGNNIWQRWIKDYNGQTYWLSINPYSFMKSSTSFPAWLNFNVGYGADGMIAARTNPKQVGQIDVPEFKRQRQFYFSIDADLKRIDKNNINPQVLLNVPNILKIPAPALEFKKDSAVKFHWLYF
jgi:uncharacterized protein YfiM (DUF2279 family)